LVWNEGRRKEISRKKEKKIKQGETEINRRRIKNKTRRNGKK
jgi:hypothetical protein